MSNAAAFFQRGLLWTAIVIGVTGVRPAVGAEIPKLDDAVKVWQKRQDEIKAVRVEWSQERTDKKGAMNRMSRLLGRVQAGDFPPEDTTIRSNCVLLVSGNRSRYTFDGQTWQLDQGVLVSRKELSVFDGREYRMLMFGLGPEKFTQMVKNEPGLNPQLRFLGPICWYFWPLRADRGGLPVRDFVAKANTVDMGGRACAVFEQPPDEQKGRRDSWEYWIDSENEYLVRRAYRRDAIGEISLQVDLVFKKGDSGESVLAEWNELQFFGDQVERSYHNTITNIVLNPPVSDEDFKSEHPVGTLVFESTSPEPSLVHDDGVLRPIESKAASYSVMVEEERQRLAAAAAAPLPGEDKAKRPAARRAEIQLSEGMFGLSSLQFHKVQGPPWHDRDKLLTFCVWVDGAPVEGSVCIASLATARKPGDDGDDEEPQMRQWQIRIVDANIEDLVFGLGSNASEGKVKVSEQLEVKVADVDRICRLTDAQKEKLLLAGQGDVKRLLDHIAGLQERAYENVEMDVKPVDLVKRSRAFLHDVLHETHAAILTLASGPFHKGSLFAKTLGSTLTADQLAAYEQQQSKGSAASDTIPSPAAKSEK